MTDNQTDKLRIAGGRMDGAVPRFTQDPNRLNRGIYAESYSDMAKFDFTATNQTLTQTIQTPQDADFLVAKLCYKAGNVDFFFNLTDASTGKQLFGNDLPAITTLGNGQEPFELVAPFAFRNNGSIRITCRNGLALAANTVYIVVHGARLYEMVRE